MRRSTTVIVGIALAGVIPFLSGCAYCLMARNEPYEARLRLRTRSPQGCRVLVAADDFPSHPVGRDGRVEFTIPPLPTGCEVRLFGRLRVADHGPYGRRVVHVFRDGEVVKRLSIRDIEGLPVGEDGYRVVGGR